MLIHVDLDPEEFVDFSHCSFQVSDHSDGWRPLDGDPASASSLGCLIVSAAKDFESMTRFIAGKISRKKNGNPLWPSLANYAGFVQVLS